MKPLPVIQKGSCNGCGKCCEAIILPVTMDQLEKWEDSPDADFVKSNWTPITKQQAIKINPEIAHWFDNLHDREAHAFICKNLHPVNKRCMVYESRPPVCSGYPWSYPEKNYDSSEIIYERFYSQNCGYRIDSERAKLICILKKHIQNMEGLL